MGGKSLRKQLEQEKRRAEVSQAYLTTGKSYPELAAEFHVSVRTIIRDIKACRQLWRSQVVGAIQEKKLQELARIDELEHEAWKAWHRSNGTHRKTVTKSSPGKSTGAESAQDPGPAEVTTTAEKLLGDPRFLDQIHKCVEQRRKILGLDEPARQTIENPEGGPVAFRIEGLEGAAWVPQIVKQLPGQDPASGTG